MGYMLAYGACVRCKRDFYFNPARVPSVRLNGHREAVCQACVEEVNPQRVANGLEPIVPLPGAYEPADEHEL